MKKVKLSSSSSSSSYCQHVSHVSELKYLPPEVWTQIFAILPVKTLIRLRCVCKSWCSIIDDPDFINIHLELCSINVDKNKLLLSVQTFIKRRPRGCVYIMTVRRADTLGKPANIYKNPGYYSLCGNCDGLLLMCRTGLDHCPEMTIRNLSCRKSLLLPPCPFPQFYNRLSDYICVFGFASHSKDYKVILITIERNEDPKAMMNFAVYTLSDQRWNVRNNGSGISHDYFKRMFESSPYRKFDCYFQGAAHWFGNDPCGDNGNYRIKHTHLVSLDFSSEKFTFMELPNTCDEQETLWFMFLIGESLAIFCISRVSSNIWVLEQESGKREWTLWFSGISSKAGFNLFKSYSRENSVVFYYESVDGSRHLRCGTKSYNLADCRVQIHGKSIKCFRELQNYSESLVLHKGYGAEDLPSFP
ncbi:F-box/kelch-repeat protein At3g06240-like [Silene latifolia]|uniref:F-box/kelch-repeat protein At3g06240-like n=1 Tax=Silene latifolia TaxID=37657 RepID=UPI003D77B0F8